MQYRIAIVHWAKSDGLASAYHSLLASHGHDLIGFLYNEPIPVGVDIVLTFAPYNRFIQIPKQMEAVPLEERPIFIHWDTEANLNPYVPWPVNYLCSKARSWLGRRESQKAGLVYKFENRFNRLRYFGDYLYAMEKGWINLVGTCSEFFARQYQAHGYPVRYIPWGTVPGWYADLGLERDIDVLWMGDLRTSRRKTIFRRIREELDARGVKLYVADNKENPFIFGDERTRMLNRSKITLNLAPGPSIWNFPQRFHMAAPNRSMVVSEPLFPHNSHYLEGQHYAAAPFNQIVETILYYLQHKAEREQIVEQAYAKSTQEWTLQRSMTMLLEYAGLKKKRGLISESARNRWSRPDWLSYR